MDYRNLSYLPTKNEFNSILRFLYDSCPYTMVLISENKFNIINLCYILLKLYTLGYYFLNATDKLVINYTPGANKNGKLIKIYSCYKSSRIIFSFTYISSSFSTYILVTSIYSWNSALVRTVKFNFQHYLITLNSCFWFYNLKLIM